MRDLLSAQAVSVDDPRGGRGGGEVLRLPHASAKMTEDAPHNHACSQRQVDDPEFRAPDLVLQGSETTGAIAAPNQRESESAPRIMKAPTARRAAKTHQSPAK